MATVKFIEFQLNSVQDYPRIAKRFLEMENNEMMIISEIGQPLRIIEMISNTFYPELADSPGHVSEWSPNKIEQYGDIYEIVGIILAENNDGIYDVTIEDTSLEFEIYEVSEVL